MRARQTWDFMQASLPEQSDLSVHSELYPGGFDAVRAVLHALAGSSRTLMIIAHNPGMEYALEGLCGESRVMKTADAALLVLETHSDSPDLWGGWRLHDFLRARALQ